MSSDEKEGIRHGQPDVDVTPVPSPTASTPPVSAPADVDDAWKYLNAHRDATSDVPDEGTADIKHIRRKVDYRIVPLVFFLYVLQYTDKLVLNYAGVMTIREDLNLTGNDFSNLVTSTYVAVVVWEIPTIYFLQKVPVAKYLAINAILWGIATACGAAATNFQTMLVCRIFLGIFEATVNPSIMLIAGRWYTKPEQAPRLSFWLFGLSVGQVFGGAISYGFQSLPPGTTMAGWRIMFILMGCLTVIIGILTFWIMPDNPMEPKWLSPKEKVAILKHISVNQTGVENRKVRMAEIWEALRDPQVWLIWLIIFLLATNAGVTVGYSATLIKNWGYTSKQATLLNMPGAAFSAIAILGPGWAIRHGIGHRWAWVCLTLAPATMGAALMSFLPNSNRAGLLAGIFLINFFSGSMTVFWNWTPANVAGATKRAFVTAMLAALSATGSAIGPQAFQAKDAPEYRPAKIMAMSVMAVSFCLTIVLFLYYVWQNKSRRKVGDKETRDAFMSPEVWVRMTDKENKAFRYVY